MSAGSEATDDTLDDAVDASQEQGLDNSADLRPAAGEQMSLQMQTEAASPVADDLAPPPVAAAPVQVSWTGLAPPVEAAVSAVTVPEPTVVEAASSEPTSTAESAVAPATEVESTAPPAEKKVVWSSSPSNSTISFGPGYSSRRDDV